MTGEMSSDSLNTSEELTVKAAAALRSGMSSTLLKEKSITLFLGKVMEYHIVGKRQIAYSILALKLLLFLA